MAFGWQEYLDLARFLQDGTTPYTVANLSFVAMAATSMAEEMPRRLA
jgi:hypothetical protein